MLALVGLVESAISADPVTGCDEPPPPRAIAVERTDDLGGHVCRLDEDGRIDCWADTFPIVSEKEDIYRFEEPIEVTGHDWLSLRLGFAQGADGAIVCGGRSGERRFDCEPGGGELVGGALVREGALRFRSGMVGLDRDGQPFGVGSTPIEERYFLPEATGPYEEVVRTKFVSLCLRDAQMRWTCAPTRQGSIIDAPTLTPGDRQLVRYCSGIGFAAGIDLDGRLVAWNYAGAPMVLFDSDGTYRAIACGNSSAGISALTDAGGLRCWRAPEEPDAERLARLAPEQIFEQPVRGRYLPRDTRFTYLADDPGQCAVTESGGVWCWPERAKEEFHSAATVPESMLPPEVVFEP